MKSNRMNWIGGLLFGSALFLLPACNKSHDPSASGDVEFAITDAPSDDEDVKAVFVTVTDIKVDGKSVSGFSKQTINIKAYQDGETKSLGTFKLNAKQYSNLQLILDTETDASGNSPGSYVQTTDDAKYKLNNNGQVAVAINSAWSATANTTSKVVIDFDLRKSIKKVDDAAVRYNFVSDAELQTAVRAVNASNAGALSGHYSETTASGADKIVVYAYKKGAYTASTEEQAQGDGEVWFKHAVTSAEVKGSGASKTYKLSFLEEGEYELHFASFHKESESGRFIFTNMLQSQTTIDGSADQTLNVHAGLSVTINSVIGL